MLNDPAAMQLEEGEIEDNSDDGLDPYTPLERPSLTTEIIQVEEVQHEESDKESQVGKCSSNTDSDDDCFPKRAKMRRTILPSRKPSKKKYSIWCKDPNEQIVDVLGSFGMVKPESDRNVENYFTPYLNQRKRKVPSRKATFASANLEPILLEELVETETSTFESLATDITEKLSETNYDLVLRIVVVCGKQKAIEFYNRTRQIEKNGGMLIANQSRRRTSGGIFIYIVRRNKNVTKEQKKEIFEETDERGKTSKSAQKKLQQQRNFKEWLEKMNYEKELESGQEELNNPPPSPEPNCPDPLPALPLRRDIISCKDLNFHQSTDSEDGPNEDSHFSNLLRKAEHLACTPAEPDSTTDIDEHPPVLKSAIQNYIDSPHKRDIVEYDDLSSMELIYD